MMRLETQGTLETGISAPDGRKFRFLSRGQLLGLRPNPTEVLSQT
jgi:hypothetical protein